MGMLQFGGPTLGWDDMLDHEVEAMQDDDGEEQD